MAPGIIAVDIRHRSTLMKSDWFGTAISNSGFMHSLLSTIALHAYVFGKGTFDAILYHRAQAIASVQAPNPSTLDFVSTTSFPHHPQGYRPNISQHLTDYCRHAGVKESLNTLVESVLVLIADLNVWFSDPESQLDPLDIQNFA